MFTLNVVKVLTVQVKLILTFRNIIQNWCDIWKYENINSCGFEDHHHTHTTGLLSLLSDFKKYESRKRNIIFYVVKDDRLR